MIEKTSIENDSLPWLTLGNGVIGNCIPHFWGIMFTFYPHSTVQACFPQQTEYQYTRKHKDTRRLQEASRSTHDSSLETFIHYLSFLFTNLSIHHMKLSTVLVLTTLLFSLHHFSTTLFINQLLHNLYLNPN